MRLYQPAAGYTENFAGYANYAAFTAARTDTTPLFQNYYGTEFQNAYFGFDTTERYNGNPSLYFVYNAIPSEDRGWYSADIGPVSSIYVRARVRMSPTFVPVGGTPNLGFDLQTIYTNYTLGGWDYIRLTIHNGGVYFIQRIDGTEQTPRYIGPASLWYSPLQYIVAAEVFDTSSVRIKVYVGTMDDRRNDLTLFASEVFAFPGALAFGDTEHFTSFWGRMPTPGDLTFRIWIYSIEVGTAPEIDGAAELSVRETVLVRTSKETPRINHVYRTDFLEFYYIESFYANKPWMFTTITEDWAIEYGRAFRIGQPALRGLFRTSPTRNGKHTAGPMTGDLAGTTNWCSRQIFEMATGFNPTMTLGGAREGIRISEIPWTDGLGGYDYSTIIINDNEIRHVWDANNNTYDDTTVIGTRANWTGGVKQVVHWAQRVSSTSVRVRIWFGAVTTNAGTMNYTGLTLVHDETYTTSYTDPTVDSPVMWSSHDTSEFPASDAWMFWLYFSGQGPVNYQQDPNAMWTDVVLDVVQPHEAVIATIAYAMLIEQTVELGLFSEVTFTALATLLDAVRVTPTQALRGRWAAVLANGVRAAERTRLGHGTVVANGVLVTATDVVQRAVLVAEALKWTAVVQPAARYRVPLADAVRTSVAIARFLGGSLADQVTTTPSVVVQARWRAGALDSVSAADVAAIGRFIVRVDAEDTITVSFEAAVRALLTGVLDEAVQITAGLMLPTGEFITWATNTRTGATSEYENYPFNSFARRGTRYLGAAQDGLYVLDGDDDAGEDIIARLRTGYAQFAGSRFASLAGMYLGMHATGAVFVRLLTGDGKSYTYRVNAQSMETTKVQVGKGLRTRYLACELETTGQDFDLDTIEFVPLGAKRRV